MSDLAPDGRLVYTLKQAEQVQPYKAGTLRAAALKASDDGEFPPPLDAVRGARDQILIPRQSLLDWFGRFPPA